ncbi:mandelate racemase/muconate lactonizing enzyme family protein [Aquidulcibacter sp.]|uniref:mandelate racemase/muconate lactonizing enzyme family protein n=1 Tax=Aquidulcibacter sp. TaxID=2052990 RepID=UPI0025C2F9FE|nr:mandelate racemase/muconate lactonizing enzyme family protein [Aquidulcibacter sp.]MCA3693090.1 mandelate racemase/muconate lactonizing enzyme family protein [Aquidulcibacter sp.]
MPKPRIVGTDTFIVSRPRDIPYLGPLGDGEQVNRRGYIVRLGNGTIYPTADQSVVVKITLDTGLVGWGETYGICAPKAVCEIINDMLAPVLEGADPEEAETIWDTLYGLMRVRGHASGFYLDALAAIDIALWDLKGKLAGVPIRNLLCPNPRNSIPAYLSGLPEATLEGRVALARKLISEGFSAVKFAAVVSHEGIEAEMGALRSALGPKIDLMVDLHWKFSQAEALELLHRLAPHKPYFAEAPIAPEDIEGLRSVAAQSPIPIAAGEEWPTDYVAGPRLKDGNLAFVQPEMAHTGITQFLRIAQLAQRHGAKLAPHATIGSGFFLSASIQVSSALANVATHEFQHSVFNPSSGLITTDMTCTDGAYHLPTGPGLGVEPGPDFLKHAVHVG